MIIRRINTRKKNITRRKTKPARMTRRIRRRIKKMMIRRKTKPGRMIRRITKR